jgi:hypothetical protein
LVGPAPSVEKGAWAFFNGLLTVWDDRVGLRRAMKWEIR